MFETTKQVVFVDFDFRQTTIRSPLLYPAELRAHVAKSNTSRPQDKPKKPCPEFPVSPHATK